MDSKGQSLTLEQMFFFTIGIIILVSVFFSYNSIRDRISELGTEDQMKEVGEMTMSGISKVSKELERNDHYSIVLDIPPRIAGNNYIVEVSNNELRVSTFESGSVALSLEGLDSSNEIRGRVVSSAGSVRINGTQQSGGGLIQISRYERI